MKKISEILEGVKSIAIAGHVHPDGDCIGSCMGMFLYLKENYPQIHVDVYLEEPREVFSYISGINQVIKEVRNPDIYDLLLLFDVSSLDRIGVVGSYMDAIQHTVCIDHHITNPGIAEKNHICPEASSASEVLFELLDKDKINKDTAEALYTGIVHDSGVFQYNSTSERTMQIGGWLMAKGIPFTRIIENSFYQKTFKQNKILGHVLENCILDEDSNCIFGAVTLEEMETYHVDSSDFEGIVSQLRLTKDVEAAIFIYEQKPGTFKVSLRSNGKADVSSVAVSFGGGGHKMAAGCTLDGNPKEIFTQLSTHIKGQLEFAG